MLILKNVKIYWAKLNEPQPAYDETKPPEWSVEVGNLSDEQVDELKKAGVGHAVKVSDNDKGYFLRLRRPAFKKDGEPSQPIEIIDDHGNLWDHNVEIGNGTVANVKIAINTWEYGKKSGRKPSLIALQIWDLVPFTRATPQQFPVKEDKVSSDKW